MDQTPDLRLGGPDCCLSDPDNRVAALCFAFGHRTPFAIKRIANAITDSNGDTMIDIALS
jgi:hypothetical protein